MNRGDLIRIVAARTGIGPDDSVYDLMGDLIDDALAEVSNANLQGWDWLTRDVTLDGVSGDSTWTFDTLAALVADNVAIVADPDQGADAPTYPVVRVREVDLVLPNLGTQPLERVSRRDIQQRFDPTAGGYPAAWTAEHQTVIIAPPLAADQTFTIRVNLAERSLATDETEPLLPDRFRPVLVQLARCYVFEARLDDARATAARLVYDKMVRAAIASSRPVGGPGRPSLMRV